MKNRKSFTEGQTLYKKGNKEYLKIWFNLINFVIILNYFFFNPYINAQ